MRVYVSTYKSYNDGNLNGRWMDIDNFSDYDEFIEACRELFEDEEDPEEIELMFQDKDSELPEWAYSENEIDSRLWDYIDLDEDDKLKFNYLVEYLSYDIDEAFDNYQDVIFYDGMTLKTVAEELVDEGLFGEVSNNLKWYLDYEAIARDLEIDGYTETSDGVFFYNG
jgi:antirestriction protein